MKLYPDQDPVTTASTYEDSRRTGFSENWSNALGLAMAEDLPVTSRMISTTVESQRTKKIRDYINDGSIPMGVSQFYEGDPNGLAGYARDVIGLEGIPTDEDFQEQRLREYATQREMSEETFADQSIMGFVGEMFGYAHAMALDPIYASSFLTGYGTAATIGQAALRVGATEAAIETVAQIPKISWKEEIGADYGGAQALTEIAFAGIGAGALAGLGKGIEGAIAKRFTPKDLTVGQATEVLERIAKDNPEIEPVLNTLRQAAPEENALKVMEADEAIDIRMADQGAKSQADVKGDLEMKAPEIETSEEEIFAKRAGVVKEEGVPRGTPLDISTEGRVRITERPSKETVDRFTEEAARAQRSAKSATKKYKKAESAAKQAEKNPAIQEDSVLGRKAKASAENARKIADERKVKMDAAVEKSEAAQALMDETAKAAKLEEGVPRGTPKPEPDTRHPLVKEADDMVVELDDQIRIMEECF